MLQVYAIVVIKITDDYSRDACTYDDANKL